MFYTIYKTTNLINGKFYIGKHKTKNLHDGYLGSGKLLKRAIKKYGAENFHKEILHECKTEKQMNILEKILVIQDTELNYNLCAGGKGGFGYINSTGLGGTKGLKHSKEAIEKIRSSRKNQKLSEETKRKISQSKIGNKVWVGRKHSEETKRKISEKRKLMAH